VFKNATDNRVIEDLFQTISQLELAPTIQPFQPEIQAGKEWVTTTREEFRSWTGRRRISGVEIHGPIYLFGSSEDSSPYTGPRVCLCKTCQATVESRFKSN
jgi:hypothetical protein